MNLNQKHQTDKHETIIKCPFCSCSIVVMHGTYLRAHPEKKEQVKIQRYRCKAPKCQFKTFSILPYPFLRVIRHFYPVVTTINGLFTETRMSQAEIARRTYHNRCRVRRLCDFCQRFFPWRNHERTIADWGDCFESNPVWIWPSFIRDFSHAFYPKKWGFMPAT